MRLHGYFRSSASWRVRIALGLKRMPFDQATYRLRRGEQRSSAYLEINPQGFVPALELDDHDVLTQSLAICEYLDETIAEPPLLPADPVGRAKVRALAQLVACDIHPIQNLRILNALRDNGLAQEAVKDWARTFVAQGLEAYEQEIAATHGRFSYGDQPTLADICLVPQLYNARRFGVSVDAYTVVSAVEAACAELPAFAAAAPELQPDADDA